MFTGASKATRTKLNHINTHVEAFGTMRAQSFEAEKLIGEEIAMDTGTFETLNVVTAVVTPKVVVNDGDGEVLLGSLATHATGTNGVVIASGSTASISLSDNTIMIGPGNSIAAASDYSIIVGQNNTVNNDHNIVVGTGSVNSREYNVLIGFGTAIASGDNAVIVGRSASASGERAVALGYNTGVDDDDGVAVGNNATVTGVTRGVSIGLNADVSGASGVAIGPNASVTGTNSLAHGSGAVATGANCVSIGALANCANVVGAVAIGVNADCDESSAVGVGYNAAVTGVGVSIGGGSSSDDGVAVGGSAVSLYNGVAVGSSTVCEHTGAAAIASGVATRIDSEFACPGMRVTRNTFTTTAAPNTFTFFTLPTEGECVAFEVFAVAHNDGASLGAQVQTFQLQNYIGRNENGATIIDDGFDLINDPSALAYTVVSAVSVMDLQLTVDPGVDTVTWSITVTIHGAPLV